MAKKSQPEEKAAGAPAWMATYGDLVTLLMCFFVLLFATSSTDMEKFQAIAQSFNPNVAIISSGGADGIGDMQGSGIMEMPNIDKSINDSRENNKKKEEELEKMASDFKTYFAENNLNDSIDVQVEADYVKITFKDGLLFASGKADLDDNAKSVLNGVASELKNYPDSEIKIEGHTDNRPINTPLFKDNLYLSAYRAISVYEYLASQGINPEQMSAEGKSEYSPVAPNDTPENRAKNRRVEIKVASQYNQ